MCSVREHLTVTESRDYEIATVIDPSNAHCCHRIHLSRRSLGKEIVSNISRGVSGDKLEQPLRKTSMPGVPPQSMKSWYSNRLHVQRPFLARGTCFPTQSDSS